MSRIDTLIQTRCCRSKRRRPNEAEAARTPPKPGLGRASLFWAGVRTGGAVFVEEVPRVILVERRAG
jgi:hypothetical protein